MTAAAPAADAVRIHLPLTLTASPLPQLTSSPPRLAQGPLSTLPLHH